MLSAVVILRPNGLISNHILVSRLLDTFAFTKTRSSSTTVGISCGHLLRQALSFVRDPFLCTVRQTGTLVYAHPPHEACQFPPSI